MCSSGDSKHTSTRGLSPNGKVTILSCLVLEVVFCLASRSLNMDGKPASAELGAIAATPSMVYLITLIFCGGWRAWGAVWGRRGGGGIITLAGCARPAGRACIGCLKSGSVHLFRLGGGGGAYPCPLGLRAGTRNNPGH